MSVSSRRSDLVWSLLRDLAGDRLAAPPRATTLEELGLDSLSFVELATVIEDELGVDLSGATIEPRTTVGDLVRVVEEAPTRPRPDGVPAGLGRLQDASKLVGGPPLRWWLALRVTGAEHVPRAGAAILAMNHESALDIPLIVVACPRRITFMAKRELFKNPFVSRSLHELGGFRVHRERFDLGAVRTAQVVLAHGGLLGMYPEGTRAPGRMLPFLEGAAWLSLSTGAPLVPAGIRGTERAGGPRGPRRVRVAIAFGPPIRVAMVASASERRIRSGPLTDELRASIEALVRPAGVALS